MSFRRRLLTACAVAVLAFGPSLVLPPLSAHLPILTDAHEAPPASPLGSPAAPLSPLLGMAIRVKDPAAAAKKFKDRASAASADYSAGVQNAGGEWEQKSAAANETYKASVAEAAAKDRYRTGVQGKGAKYTKNATTLGPQRFQTGIANAQDAYAQAMTPVLNTIANLTLPPRGVKGTNQERSNIVAMALRKMKVGA